MQFYPTILTFHIMFASVWLFSFFIEMFFRKMIKQNINKPDAKSLISLYLKIINLMGTVGSMGILLTGIWMVALNPGYGFFDVTKEHWLITKQVIMIAELVIIMAVLIPNAKKIRLAIGKGISADMMLTDSVVAKLKKLYKINNIQYALVAVNFLLAITHRYLG